MAKIVNHLAMWQRYDGGGVVWELEGTGIYQAHQGEQWARKKRLCQSSLQQGHFRYLAFYELTHDCDTKEHTTKITDEFWFTPPEVLELNIVAKTPKQHQFF